MIMGTVKRWLVAILEKELIWIAVVTGTVDSLEKKYILEFSKKKLMKYFYIDCYMILRDP